MPVPMTVQDLLLQRFDTLSVQALMLVKCLAVIGGEFVMEDIDAVALKHMAAMFTHRRPGGSDAAGTWDADRQRVAAEVNLRADRKANTTVMPTAQASEIHTSLPGSIPL